MRFFGTADYEVPPWRKPEESHLIVKSRMVNLKTMDVAAFHGLFIEFCELNRQYRSLELWGETSQERETVSRKQKALDSLVEIYSQAHHRALLRRVLGDPYFPLNMLRKLNLEWFVKEPGFTGLSEDSLGRIAAEHLVDWAEMFYRIRQYLRSLNSHSQVSSMELTGSPQECLPESSWCDYCGGCCEIRGGPAEFTGGFEPPEWWVLYFHGDGCRHQRFCPFLFEYYATGKFFCSIYRVKPECCWAFDRDECEFLQKDVARQASK